MKTLFIGMLLIYLIIASNQIGADKNKISRLESVNSALKAEAAISQRYTDAIEKELIQAWMDVCLFKTDADMSDDYDAQYMECECVVADNMNKLAGGGE